MSNNATSNTAIEKDSLVRFHYHLKNDQGQTIDRSSEEPLSYIHGHGAIIPGLEAAMQGRAAQDSFSIHIPPSLGYGLFDEDKVFVMEPGDLPGEIEVDTLLELTPDDGLPFQARVRALRDDEVELDGNHPLAGQDLHFDIQIVEVRPAQADELAQLAKARAS